MSSLVVAFAGGIASGKSELSTSVAALLGWPRVGFGEYVRTIARQRGLDIAKPTLQQLGESLIAEGWEKFCRSVLAQSSWIAGQSIIVDGVRHSEALYWLQRITAPSKVILVLIELDSATREGRFAGREGTSDPNWVALDSHSTEKQVKGVLKEMADLVVDGNQPVNELTSKIVSWVREHLKSEDKG